MKLQINVELLHPLNENLQKYQNIHSFQKKKKKKYQKKYQKKNFYHQKNDKYLLKNLDNIERNRKN